MRHLPVFSLTLLVLATGATMTASAQPTAKAPAVDDAANARADDLTLRGSNLALKLRWADAEPLFREAWALKHSYDIGGDLGLAELALGKHRDAAEHLSFALKSFPANGKPAHRVLIQESLAKAKPFVAVLSVAVNVKDAKVFVDGKEVGSSPLADDVFVEPGSRVVEAKLAGYADATQTIAAAKGGAQAVTLTLARTSPVPTATATATGSGAQTGLPPKEVPGAGMRKAIMITGASAAGAGLIAGIMFTALANGKASATREKAHTLIVATGSDACAQPSGACQEVAGLFHDRAAFTNAAGWSFVGAGALGAATVIYALATKSGAKAAVHATPVVTAQGAGVLVGGAW